MCHLGAQRRHWDAGFSHLEGGGWEWQSPFTVQAFGPYSAGLS